VIEAIVSNLIKPFSFPRILRWPLKREPDAADTRWEAAGAFSIESRPPIC
jgi:hypothetical protein